ncbi:Inosine-uridine preferring nucleoside hydrolase [Polystyrenella longa]|uniref:Inosine-uridine preferring nucleoside hydrolase n=1 Tax=Polystyrenella longa TaxID=2528007 RepID=A0A518CPY0_9PLAN|nr:nucleoside hydrolase [Polystyrenella longa]QDU81254.1 Inosine-uridine preferring nucleoside hydrolase [Polystyrenella longa]
MKFCTTTFGLLLLMFSTSSLLAVEPLPVIFDTDMESDCDDSGALAILHALADRGEFRILATPISARHTWSGPCVDAINTWFGRPDLPIGLPAATPNKQGSRYAATIAKEFPHDFPDDISQQPAALAVYRQALAGEKDGSVVVITVGDVTNIRDLLLSPPDDISSLSGMELARTKVKCWYCMGTVYPADLDPAAWGNFKMDPKATVEAVRDWPGEIVFTGAGVFADKLSTGAGLAQLEGKNPIRRVYELYYKGTAKDRHSADQITVMVAARGTGSPWKQVRTGHNHIFENGTHEWREAPNDPRQSYIAALDGTATYEEVAAEMEALMKHQPKE